MTTQLRWQLLIGVGLACVGGAALARRTGTLDDYAYPIAWWGVLLLVDAWNARRHGLSLWLSDPRQFLSMTVPVSVLVWLFFEVLNYAAPQWAYHTRIREIWKSVPLGFVSFATVIPIVVEAWWLVGGGRRVPDWPSRWFTQHRAIALAAAVVLTILPLFNKTFWFNQGMWIAPMLALLPETSVVRWWVGARSLGTIAAAGLVSGLAWEALNYPSFTGWHYLILPDVPHLFQMPVPGYLGFVPFALSTLIVYEWQRTVAPRLLTSVILYAVGCGGLYVLRTLYAEHGLFQFK